MKTFAWLLEQFDWDFAMIVLNETDFAQHLFPGDASRISSVYKEADRAIGELTGTLDSGRTTLFVVSDHGFNIARRAFRVNDWLIREGAMKEGVPAARRGLVGRAVDLALRRRMTARLVRRIERHLPERARSMAYSSPLQGEALPIGVCCLAPQPHSYVPLFVSAMTSRSEYEDLIKTVQRSTEKLIDEASGLKPVLRVLTKRELYEGVYSTDAPDLTLELREDYVVSEKIFNSSKLFHDTLQGVHEPAGVLIAYGRGVKRGAQSETLPSVLDITPTVLHLLGVTPPGKLDGRVLQEMIG
jgi:predicted AlkP superfamily phosphohydrolase/phosphomutase